MYAESQAQSPLPVVTASGATEAIKRIVLEDVWVEVLVPHRIGDDNVVSRDSSRGVFEPRVDHGVAALDLHIHVVDYGVQCGQPHSCLLAIPVHIA